MKRALSKQGSRLTVFILTYNQEQTISTAIESILEQKTKYPFIIHILEDHSTDSTLEVCEGYRKRYPDKIKITAQKKNTKALHSFWAQSEVKTEYFTLLEGDDYWCDEKKIETALDILERNPEYIIFAHDTLYKRKKRKRSLVHEELSIDKISNPVTIYNAPHFHTSARIYRNIIDYKKQFGYRKVLNNFKFRGEIYVYFAFLDKGPLYYYDKIMSVYNISEKGVWNKLPKAEKIYRHEKSLYKRNMLLNYRYDKLFTQKVYKNKKLRKYKKALGTKLGWKYFLVYMKFISLKDLLINRFKNIETYNAK